MPFHPITQAGAPIPRPQPMRCLCGYGHDDGFTIMCQSCFRWCHGSCFDINGTEHVPKDWQCWICAPLSLRLAGLDKGKAVRIQAEKLERMEEERRTFHFNRMDGIPALRWSALNVKESYEMLPSIKSIDLRDRDCKSLLDRALELLITTQESVFYDDEPVHQIPLPEEMASLFARVRTCVVEWARLSTVKVHIRNREILETITSLTKDIDRYHGMMRYRLPSTIPLDQKLQFYEAIKPIKQTRDNPQPILVQPSLGLSPDSVIPAHQIKVHEEEISEGALPYQNLTHVVRRSLQPYTQEVENKIHGLLSEFSSLDRVVALARCRQFRYKLLELCSTDLQREQMVSIDDSVTKDERLINRAVLRILQKRPQDRDDIDKVLSLQESDAEKFIDLLQTAIEANPAISAGIHRSAHRLLVKLCENSGILPSSLSVEGVELIDQNAIYGGGFADIYRARYKGQEVALKRMRVFQKGAERHKIHRAFCKEALLWKRLQHPNLLPFLGVDSLTFSPFFCMVSPWMDRGTLNRYIAEHPNVNLEELLLQIAEALSYLHAHSVVHGDLRGGNILIGSNGEAYLADFGLTVISEATAVTHTSNASGSTRWMAPELHDPESFDLPHFAQTCASDVYAFACVCLEAYTGAPPFSKLSNDSTVMLRVVRGDRPERPTETRRPLSDTMWNMIQSAWVQQPNARPSIAIIVEILRRIRVGA